MRYKSDATIKELKSRLGLAEEDLGRAKTELSNLRKNNANLDGDFHEQSKALSALETKVALLQQDARNKDDFIRQTSELLETEKLHKVKLPLRRVRLKSRRLGCFCVAAHVGSSAVVTSTINNANCSLR